MAHVQLGPLIVRIKENKSDNPPPALDYPLVYTDKLLYLEHNSQNKSCPVVIQFVKLGKRLHFPKSSDSFCFVYVEFSEAERRSNRMRNFHVTISNNKRESSHPKYSTCAAGNLASETGHLLIKMSPLPQILSTSDFASVQLLVLYAADCDGKTPLFLWKNVYRKILSEAGKEQLEPRCMEFKNVDDIKNSFPPTGIKRKNGIYSIRDSSRILKMKIWNVSGPAGQKRPKQSNNYEFEINYEAIKVEAKNIGILKGSAGLYIGDSEQRVFVPCSFSVLSRGDQSRKKLGFEPSDSDEKRSSIRLKIVCEQNVADVTLNAYRVWKKRNRPYIEFFPRPKKESVGKGLKTTLGVSVSWSSQSSNTIRCFISHEPSIPRKPSGANTEYEKYDGYEVCWDLDKLHSVPEEQRCETDATRSQMDEKRKLCSVPEEEMCETYSLSEELETDANQSQMDEKSDLLAIPKKKKNEDAKSLISEDFLNKSANEGYSRDRSRFDDSSTKCSSKLSHGSNPSEDTFQDCLYHEKKHYSTRCFSSPMRM